MDSTIGDEIRYPRESMWDYLEDAYDSASQAVSDTVDSASDSVSSWLGEGASTGDAATATYGTDAQAEEPDSWWGRVGQTVGDFGRGLSQEGVSGLLDMDGMLDRQDAQRDLDSRFEVVGDDFVGPRNHNQVTQEEYERIARTYSNIRLGRGDLTVDGGAIDDDEERAEWQQGTMNNIADMMMTTAGREQIYDMSNNVKRDDEGEAETYLPWGLGPEIHHQTNIVPLLDEHGNQRTDNAYADPVDSSDMMRNADGSRGDGTDVNIRWNPSAAVGDMRADVVLAHEMQHARHETQGTMARGDYHTSSGGVGPDAQTWTDVDGNVHQGMRNWERQAVGLTRTDSPTGGHYPGDPDGCTENTYRLQRNQLGLGDRHLPRTAYGTSPGEAATDEELQQAWDAFNASGQSTD